MDEFNRLVENLDTLKKIRDARTKGSSLYSLCSHIAWLYKYEEVDVRELAPHVRRPLTSAYYKEQVLDGDKRDLVVDAFMNLCPGHIGLIGETALDYELDGYDLAQHLTMQLEDLLVDDINDYLSDFLRDYRESNGLPQPSYEDELCVEGRG